MIRLVADCERYADSVVLTTGYATFEFEDYTVCPSSELARVDPASCFWLEASEGGIPADNLRALKDHGGHFVHVEGRIGCSRYLFAGSIDEIELIVDVETGKVLWTTDPAMKAVLQQR